VLKNITGWMDWSALPALEAVSFPAGLSDDEIVDVLSFTKAEKLYINGVRISNTSVSTIDGLTFQEVDTLEITNNPNLHNITLDPLQYVHVSMNISANAQGASISLKGLYRTGDMTICNASALFIPSLNLTYGGLTLSGNTFASVELNSSKSLENLTITNNPYLVDISLPLVNAMNSLTVEGNPDLVTLSLPALRQIESQLGPAFTIVNNTNLGSFTMDNLTEIYGLTTLEGNFHSINMPRLTTTSAFRLNTTVSGFNCSFFDLLPYYAYYYSPNDGLARYWCSAYTPGSVVDSAIHATTQAPSSGGSPFSDNSSSPSISRGAIAGIVVGAVLAVLTLFLVVRQVKARRRRDREALRDREAIVLDDIDRPPGYRVRGLPGEVPPVYKETASIHEIPVGGSSMGTETDVEDGDPLEDLTRHSRGSGTHGEAGTAL